MLAIERILAEKLNWSLYDMDRTDIESLIPFVFYIADSRPKKEIVYADQADWL